MKRHLAPVTQPCTSLSFTDSATYFQADWLLKSPFVGTEVLNIDTNAIQPLTLESIANGTSVNQALQELRCNNTASGRLVTEAFLHALKSNPSLCKLGYPVTDAYFRGEIDKQLTRNNDAARKRRLEEKRRREAEGGAEKSETPKVQAKTQSAGYPAAKPTPPAATPKPAEAEPSVQSAVAEGEEKAEAKLEDEKPGAREAQEAQELQKGQEAQEAQEAKKAKEDQEAQEAKKAKEEQEAQEAKKAKEEQEAQEAKKAKEEQEAQEAKKAKEEQEAQEAKKAKEEQEAQEAKKAKEEQEAQEAKKAKEEQEAQEAKKAKEEQEAREAKKAKEEQEAQEAKKAKEEQEGTEAEEAQEAQPVTKAAPKTPVEPEDSAALPGMVEAAALGKKGSDFVLVAIVPHKNPLPLVECSSLGKAVLAQAPAPMRSLRAVESMCWCETVYLPPEVCLSKGHQVSPNHCWMPLLAVAGQHQT